MHVPRTLADNEGNAHRVLILLVLSLTRNELLRTAREMRLLSICLPLLFSVSLTASQLPSDSWTSHGLEPSHRNEIRAAFDKGIQEHFIPGGSLMIIHKGEVILHEGFGVADLETQRPFEANAPCRIASLTKPHTTTTLAILAGEGKLSFSDPVSKYLPQFKDMKVRGQEGRAKQITLAMCLSHTAGFASNNQLKSGEFSLDFNGSLAEVVEELASHELFYEPATAFGYGRLGYMTAARVAEIVTGKPFEEVMDEFLFKRVGSSQSTFDYESVLDIIPTPYIRTKTGLQIRKGEPLGSVINPGGSLVATPTDVARMYLLHRNRGKVEGQQVVPASILQQMYVSQPGRGKAKYGLGFNIIKQRPDGGASRIQHTGASGTIGIIDFDLDLILLVLTQVPQTQTNKWRGPLLKTIFNVFEN